MVSEYQDPGNRGRRREFKLSKKPGRSAGSIELDLYCLHCGYNLRGLAGDPIRCPECGRPNELADLEGRSAASRARLRELRTALDVSVLGAALLAAGLIADVVLAVNGSLPGMCALTGLLLALLPLSAGSREVRRLIKPGLPWRRDFVTYTVCSAAVGIAVPGLVIGAGWLVGSAVARRTGATLPAVGAALATGLVGAAAVYGLHPLAPLRRRQQQAFDRLLRLVQAAPPRS